MLITYLASEPAPVKSNIASILLKDWRMDQELYSKGSDWASHIEVDGNLVTGQNSASSEAAAGEVIKLLNK